MNLEKANELVKDYLDFYAYRLSRISSIAGEDWKVIETPFFLTNRDLIDIHIRETETGFELSDDGLVLNQLELAGLDLEDPKFVRVLTEQINSSGVRLAKGDFNDYLRKSTTAEKFPQAFHEFIQCILALDALSVVNSLR